MKFILAFIIMLKAHKGQKDKAGKPYIFHPIKVMLSVKGYKAKVVALLHDVVEDSDITIEYLEKHFDKDIIDAIRIITKEDGVKYKDYIKKIKENDLARIVKISDLTHNMKLSRLKNITKKDIIRTKIYSEAYHYLIS